MKDIVILGASGFAKELLWLLEGNNEVCRQWNILGFVDQEKNGEEPVTGYGIIGNDEWLLHYPHPVNAVCGFGSPALRRKVIQTYRREAKNVLFPTLISNSANISTYASLEEGCIACSGVKVAPDVRLGAFVVLNLNCTVGHDTVIEAFATVNPGANVSGNVLIGNDSEIGTGSCIIQGKRLGPKTVVGAGSVIIRNIPGHCTVVGNPGRILEK
ncbi:MAG: acetyltransferase [Oscillibacter sp.]|jgi:sugar O-acyltransferase (sialic acid O-acetyltransferase NeuD family)|nr:acetyltransferase [Oscillibacter sp.]